LEPNVTDEQTQASRAAVHIESASIAVSESTVLIRFFGMAVRSPDKPPEQVPLFVAALPGTLAKLFSDRLAGQIKDHAILIGLATDKSQ
jgi:hypothetical protein